MTTGYKTLRNKALQTANRLILCKCNDEIWSAPGGYFAVNFDIYQDMPLRSYHLDVREQGRPDLGKVLSNAPNKYEAVTSITASEDEGFMYLSGASTEVKVNSDYLQLLQKLYPEATMSAAGTFDPVRFEQNGKLVAVLMPVRK
jgi:hypothetical protein